MALYNEDPLKHLRQCELEVERTVHAVHQANQEYIKACRDLAEAKMTVARSTPHPWMGMQVYRIMGGEHIRNRIEHGVVTFKEIGDPDYGNPHIAPGSYYVLVNDKSAHLLSHEWEIDLL